MILKVDSKTCIVFDLDDTLYKEYDFLTSAFCFISREIFTDRSDEVYNEMITIYNSKGNVFDYLINKYKEYLVSKEYLLSLYRNHIPNILPNDGVTSLLTLIKNYNGKIGLLTDGRSITQRNKIASLGIIDFFDDIIISEEFGTEKPAIRNYDYFADKYKGYNFIIIADNLKKDFITPKRMGWLCIGIFQQDHYIHQYKLSEFNNEFLPHLFISSFNEIKLT